MRSRMGRSPLTRFGIVLVIICCLMGKGCEGKSDTDSKEITSAEKTKSNVVTEVFADDEGDECSDYAGSSNPNTAVTTKATSTSKAVATSANTSTQSEASAHVHSWVYSSYETVASQQNVQVCWECGTHYTASKCPSCGSSSYYATTDAQYATVQERQCSTCGAYEYLGKKNRREIR